MDFILQWLLGHGIHGACTIGEVFYTINQIDDGDPESWVREFLKLAERVEKRAEDVFQRNHTVSARETFLRAAIYYRAILADMLPHNPDYQKILEKMRECFKKGGALFNPPIESIEVPFEGKILPGYFIKAKNDGEKHKTLIMIGGGETFAMDLYFYIAPAALRRGYNFLTVDLPGQGNLPSEGLFFRHDTEIPMKAVVDYVLSRPEVDSEKLAAYGISGGGYYVPRAAIHDKRIKACIANSMIFNLYRIWANSPVKRIKEVKRDDPHLTRIIELLAWRWGLKPNNIFGLIEANKEFIFDPSQITCPLLILIGEGEYNSSDEIKSQQHHAIDTVLNSHSKLIIAPANEGGAHHCQGDNLALMSSLVFDWLDEIFD
jgi:alpha-beta hydrolase superfamily lysophospholipase